MSEPEPLDPSLRVARWLGPLLFLSIVLLDVVTKEWALANLSGRGAIKVTDFFNLVLVWNPGISFGIFQSGGEVGRWLLVALALAISIILAFWLRWEQRFWPKIAIWLILAGALGNVGDRVRFGAVVDFVDLHAFGYHWPAFNVADSVIVLGAAILIIDSLVVGSRALGRGGSKE